ncbi:MAG: PCRF domain-containing protein, partial [Oscillospiraceae bacterium]|nr:PCRF domain-containing protein [Oscillospiraceae bacterium]
MLENLSNVEQRFCKIQEMLCDPEVLADLGKYRDLMQELKRITPVTEAFRAYQEALRTQEEAQDLLDASGLEKDFRALVQEELEAARLAAEETRQRLRVLLLPRDPNDDKSVIIEIRGGAGGGEAALFAGVLFRMYSMYAETKGWKPEILSASETELGGFKEISFLIEGEGAYSRFKFESGVHRVQRVPETESQGRIHTSTVTVAVLPEAEEVELDINPADLQVDTFRSSGAGGQ